MQSQRISLDPKIKKESNQHDFNQRLNVDISLNIQGGFLRAAGNAQTTAINYVTETT